MGCGSCGTSATIDGKPQGCKSNGGCSTGGCNKMNVFDWLSDMDVPLKEQFDVVEVRFKNGNKDFFKNKNGLELYTGDPVVVDVPNGHHIGHVSLQGELVRLQMNRKKVKNDSEIRSLYRVASSKDLEKFEQIKNKEQSCLYRTREIIQQQKLKMKLTDIEYQADGSKATFFYSADERVDFRELIKVLASEFKIRIEMKQISLRQEAGRLGGIGSCGRELCCSTWISDFKNVNTSAARYQNLSLNPGKLSGQCGRLKCCLNYELDTYMMELKDIPKVKGPLKLENGKAVLQKTDIFKKIMWFSVGDDNNWQALPAKRVAEIVELNKKGEVPATLFVDEIVEEVAIKSINSDLERLDKKYKNKSKASKKPNRNKKKKFFKKKGAQNKAGEKPKN